MKVAVGALKTDRDRGDVEPGPSVDASEGLDVCCAPRSLRACFSSSVENSLRISRTCVLHEDDIQLQVFLAGNYWEDLVKNQKAPQSRVEFPC